MQEARCQVISNQELLKTSSQIGRSSFGSHGTDRWRSVEYHGYVLSGLRQLPESEHGEPFVEFLRDSHLDCPMGLSALVRVVASSAQIALLTWLLDESVQLDEGYPTGPKTFEEVKDEATGLPWWTKPW